MAEISGRSALMDELNWLSGGMDGELSNEIHDITVEARGVMADSIMPIDTGYMSSTTEYDLGYLRGSVFNFSTHYAGFVNGSVPVVNRPYTITPFVAPTVDFIMNQLDSRMIRIVSAKRR